MRSMRLDFTSWIQEDPRRQEYDKHSSFSTTQCNADACNAAAHLSPTYAERRVPARISPLTYDRPASRVSAPR